MNESAVQALLSFLKLVTALGVVLIVYVTWVAYDGRREIVNAAREACENSKLDRIDNAASWTAHRDYITSVTAARSVKEDVKRAARKANLTYTLTSAGLRVRANIDCHDTIPDASLRPSLP